MPPPSEQTHYDTLQIPHTATPEEVKAAYRSLIIGFHPDKQPPGKCDKNISKGAHIISDALSGIDLDDEEEGSVISNDGTNSTDAKQSTQNEKPVTHSIVPDANVEEVSSLQNAFHHIQTAYDCLRDPEKRRQYDESISRKEEREEWRKSGASEVKLSEMECDWCCVLDEGNSDDERSAEEAGTEEDAPIQKVYFHPCRCGDTFQVFHEEVLDAKSSSGRVWQCQSCSLTIRINIDITVD